MAVWGPPPRLAGMTEPRSPLTQAYAAVRPTYVAFTASLSGVISTIAKAKGVEVHQIEQRTKELDSFDDKVNREDKLGKYADFTDVTDLSGIRIITYLPSEVDLLIRHLRESMDVDEANSRVVSDEMETDRFGYQSTHLVLSYSAERLALPDFARFADMKAEIQVRTVLQHAWAAIDWKLRYKNEHETPRPLRRRLFRISALLESVDDDFTFLNERISELREQYENEIKAGALDIELNLESIQTYLNAETSDRPAIKRLIGIVDDIPNIQFSEQEGSTQRLITQLDELGIKTIIQLDKLIIDSLNKNYDDIKKIYREWASLLSVGKTDLNTLTRMVLLLSEPKEVQSKKIANMFSVKFREVAKSVLGI